MTQSVDFVCYSHLRWNFVFQRPQHLLSRCAKQHRVFFLEEPIFDGEGETLRIIHSKEGVVVVTPVLPKSHPREQTGATQQRLFSSFFADKQIRNHVSWYYTPMALDWLPTHEPAATIYDCMDELSLFKGAPATLVEKERELFNRADLVFTGGVSLFEYKLNFHKNVYAFPSSVEVEHFGKARKSLHLEPADQAGIPHPRLGFFGVIDERMDLELLDKCAELAPDLQFILIGPVVKIDIEHLPKRANIHYLGQKNYSELPDYIAGWEIALMPFARNDATKFISPTKTPEYLAAGKPVVSTSIRDVVRPYGEKGFVKIADTAEEFVDACRESLSEDFTQKLSKEIDPYLSQMSWDRTWAEMRTLVLNLLEEKSNSLMEISY